MVDIGEKPITKRTAVAEGKLFLKKETLKAILGNRIPKGNVLHTAKLAGIMAAKKTAWLIPLCHPLEITHADIDFSWNKTKREITVKSTVSCLGRTGVEMESLTAVAVSCLTIYDMCKPIDKDIVIGEIKLLRKTGGKSGTYERK